MHVAQQAQGLALDLSPEERTKIQALFKGRAAGGAIEVEKNLGERVGGGHLLADRVDVGLRQRGFGFRCFTLPSFRLRR